MSLILNGTTGRIVLPNESRYDRNYNQAFSAGGWFMVDNLNALGGTLASKIDGAGGDNWIGYLLYVSGDPNYKLAFFLCPDITSEYLLAEGNTTVTADVWHHTYFTYDGSGATTGYKIYLDGVEDTPYGDISVNAPIAASTLNNHPYTLGADYNTEAYDHDGLMQNWEFFDRVLSVDEINQLMFHPGSIKE